MAHTTRRATIYTCTCERCGHKWESLKLPSRCAGCASPYWQTPRGILQRGGARKRGRSGKD